MYLDLITREGGKTTIKNKVVINMDKLKNSQNRGQPLMSMDFALVVNNKNTKQLFILVDCKFNIKSPKKIDKNITNDSIMQKFKASRANTISLSTGIPCYDEAIFLFLDRDFEQIRNTWSRRTLNNPKNKAIRLSDFKKIF